MKNNITERTKIKINLDDVKKDKVFQEKNKMTSNKIFNLRKRPLYIFRLNIILFIAKLFNVYVDNEYPWVYRYKDDEIEIKDGYVKK